MVFVFGGVVMVVCCSFDLLMIVWCSFDKIEGFGKRMPTCVSAGFLPESDIVCLAVGAADSVVHVMCLGADDQVCWFF